jgi:hypothetical protein
MKAVDKQLIVSLLDMEDWPTELVAEYRWYQFVSDMYEADALSDDEFDILSNWIL